MGSRHISERLLRPVAPLSRTLYTSTLYRMPAPWTQRTISTSQSSQQTQPQPKQSGNDVTSRVIDGLFGNMSRQPSSVHRPLVRTRTATEDRTFGVEFSNPGASTKRASLNVENMLSPSTPSRREIPMQKQLLPEDDPDTKWPRLNASSGRSVPLDPVKGRDIVRGLNMLGSLIGRNKVRADFYKQRFHERPGLKRKRLKSERWRFRFKNGFRDVTARVSELTRKGW